MNIIEENNKSNMVTQGTTTAVLSTYFHSAFIAMLPWLFAAVPLVITDLRLGRKKAKKNGEDVTINKTVRMTMDKCVSYVCWVWISTSMSITFGNPSIKFWIMGLVYFLEVWSSLGKWLYIRFDIKVNDTEMLRILAKAAWNKITGIESDFAKVFKEAKDNGTNREASSQDTEMGDRSGQEE